MEYRRAWRLLFGAILAVSLIVQNGCGRKIEETSESSLPAGEKVDAGEKGVGVRLAQSKSGSVLILEEPDVVKTAPAAEDDSLSGKPAPKLPAGHKAFRDQHIRIYVGNIQAGLENAIKAAAASGGRVINHPVKGFDNMGPNERTLVFDSRTYPSFLKRLQAQGKVVHPEIGLCDYVTVRLTVLEKEKIEE